MFNVIDMKCYYRNGNGDGVSEGMCFFFFWNVFEEMYDKINVLWFLKVEFELVWIWVWEKCREILVFLKNGYFLVLVNRWVVED